MLKPPHVIGHVLFRDTYSTDHKYCSRTGAWKVSIYRVTTSTTSAPAGSSKATIGSVRGDVSITHPDGSSVDPSGGEQLREGDEISTGPDSGVTLQFPDGSTLTVRPMTQISVRSLITQKGSVKVEMNLEFGKLAAKVNKAQTATPDYSVKTPSATASVRGTRFTVAYTSGTSSVAVSQGAVYVKPARASLKPAIVVAGSGVRVTRSTLVATGPPVRTAQRAVALVKIAILETAKGCKTGPASLQARGIPGSGDWTITAKVTLGGTAAEALFRIDAGVLRPAYRTAGLIATGCR